MKKRIAIAVIVLGLGGVAAWVLLRHAEPAVLSSGQAVAEGRSVVYRSPAADSHHPAALPGHRTLKGRVVDPHGQPVAGATVLATAPDTDDVLSERMCECGNACGRKLLECGCAEAAGQIAEAVADRRGEVVPLARATTQADGTFEFEGLSDGEVAVWGQHATAGVGTVTSAKVGAEPIEVRLAAGQWVRGVVHDEDGRPVVGTATTAVFAAHSRFFDGVTDARGAFRIGPLPEGKYEVVATSVGFLPAAESSTSGPTSALQMVLQRPRSLGGHVEDASGKPPAELQVHLSGEHKKTSAKMNAKGFFSFSGLRPGTYTLEAIEGELGAVVQVHLGKTSVDDVVIKLGASSGVDVVVHDAAGLPLSGAKVQLRSFSRLTSAGGQEEAKTGADGHARVKVFQGGSGFVTASADGYLEKSKWDVALTVGKVTPVDLTLAPAALVSGVVVDEDSKPVEGAKLKFTPGDTDDEASDSRETSTHADGGFVAEDLGPGPYHLRVQHPDFLDATLKVTAPARNLWLRLVGGGVVDGTVVDAQGLPQSEATVYAEQVDAEGKIAASWSHSAKTDAAGKFRLQGFVDGKYLALALLRPPAEEVPIERRASLQFEVVAGRARSLLLKFEGASLSGRVVDAQGVGISGASVGAATAGVGKDSAEAQPGRGIRRWRFSQDDSRRAATDVQGSAWAESGVDGRFRLENVGPGTYQVRASKQGFVAALTPVVAKAGQEDVVVLLTGVGHVRGRCVNALREPVKSFAVNRKEFNSTLGAFELEVSAPGPLSLHVTAEGYPPLDAKVEATVGEDKDIGEVVLSKGRALRGEVVDAASGAPVSDAWVMWSAAAAPAPKDFYDSLTGREPVKSDDQGRFSIADLTPGPITLMARRQGYREARVAVPDGQSVVRVSLSVGSTVSGHVFDPKGAPVAGAAVTANRPGEEDTQATTTDAEGAYTLRGLSPGLYWVSVVASSAKGKASYVAQSITVLEAGTPALDFRPPEESATVTVHLVAHGVATRWMQAFLVQGEVPTPTSAEAWVAAGGPVVQSATRSDPWVFAGIPLGRYTFFAMGFAVGGMSVERESLAVTQPGALQLEFQVGPHVTVLAAPGEEESP